MWKLRQRRRSLSVSLVNYGPIISIAIDNELIISPKEPRVNITGIDNHSNHQDLWIVTAGRVCSSDKGKILVVMHQYAYKIGLQTINSLMLMVQFSIEVDDCSLFLVVLEYSLYMLPMFYLSFKMDCHT